MTKELLMTVTSCLVIILFQLECADEDQINSDFAVKLMEEVGFQLQSFARPDAEAFISIIGEMASGNMPRIAGII